MTVLTIFVLSFIIGIGTSYLYRRDGTSHSLTCTYALAGVVPAAAVAGLALLIAAPDLFWCNARCDGLTGLLAISLGLAGSAVAFLGGVAGAFIAIERLIR